MSQSLPKWLERILVDLRGCSTELFEGGLAPTTPGIKSDQQSAPLRATLQAVDTYCKILPFLISELGAEESSTVAELVPSQTPRSAVRSNRPSDYSISEGQAIPRRWLRIEASPELRLDALRWLIGVGLDIKHQLQAHTNRLTKQVEVAKFVRGGESSFAFDDIKALDLMLTLGFSSEQRLRHAIASIYRVIGKSIAPMYQLPYPFPRTPAWSAFRRQAHYIRYPQEMLGVWLGELLREPIPVADIPFLYQRWCGLQIIQAASRLRWEVQGDYVGALYLGGLVQLARSTTVVDLWVEPRLATSQAGKIGWKSEKRGEELTPDFLFVCGEIGERDAFVLDATLSTNVNLQSAKGKYLDRLIGEDVRSIAGVPVYRRPLRSWAMAPIKSNVCQLRDPHGWTGVIPLDACSDDFSGLEAWISDVFKHAERTRPSLNTNEQLAFLE